MKKWMMILMAVLLLAGCNAPEQAKNSAVGDPPSSGVSPDAVGGDTSENPDAAPPGLAGDISSSGVSGAQQPPETMKLAVPEGYTLARIGMALEEMGICTVQEFIDAAQTIDYSSYPLVAAIPSTETRCFLLEGYLFPATYDTYADESPESIIRRMLEHTESRFTAELRQQVESSGYTVDEILTIASIIEKESFGQQNMPGVSGVLHNRLNDGMRLECDVTIVYVEGAIKPFIDGDINRYNDYYNTYKCPALPASAICNPGMAAIQAALAPEDHPYYFFVTDADSQYHYAETFEEHKENIAAIGLGG